MAVLLLSNVAFLCLHILLEGVINKFTVMTVPNKERSFRLEGVRNCRHKSTSWASILYYIIIISICCADVSSSNRFVHLHVLISSLD